MTNQVISKPLTEAIERKNIQSKEMAASAIVFVEVSSFFIYKEDGP